METLTSCTSELVSEEMEQLGSWHVIIHWLVICVCLFMCTCVWEAGGHIGYFPGTVDFL